MNIVAAMTTPFTYEFGYSWSITWGHLVPLALFGGLAALGIWLKWRRWLVIGSSLVAMWAIAGLLITHFLFRLGFPQQLPTDQFLTSGTGRVVDIGAGSGRAAIGLLLAKPRVTVTAVDIYKGYYGIDDNTPERFMLNARIAGVADRADAKVGDARELPLETGAYDGAISLAAIDHIRRADIPKALAEAARILKPARRVSADGCERRRLGEVCVAARDRPSPEGRCEPLAVDARIVRLRDRGTGNAAGGVVLSYAEAGSQFSIIFLTTCMNSSAMAPSMTRWS